MHALSKLSVAVLAACFVGVAACGSSSKTVSDDGDDSGGTGQGGASSGTGGTAASGGSSGIGTGGAGTGGTIAGAGGCGPCLRIVCLPPVLLMISPDLSAGASTIDDLKVESPGLNLSCTSSGNAASCQWQCQAQSLVPDGHYVVTISAPGFETQTIEFDMESPTNCGCCGCFCGASFLENVTLRPTGEPTPGCCLPLSTDSNNCGECGHTCPIPISCVDGGCGPSYASCLAGSSAFASCDAYCENFGLACTASCGEGRDEGMRTWPGGMGMCSATGATPRTGTCSEALASNADYQCCCEEP